MAPEPEILKRKRSRPSDWWAADSSTSTPQQAQPSPPEPVKASNPFTSKKATPKVPAAEVPADGGLKRKRSRPSDWWAADTSSSTPQQIQPAPPKFAEATKPAAPVRIPQEFAPTEVPEHGSVKRKRSRPSDWWAADISSSSIRQAENVVAKPVKPLKSGASGRGIQEAPAAGNRGKAKRARDHISEGESGDEDELAEPMKSPVGPAASKGKKSKKTDITETAAGKASSSAPVQKKRGHPTGKQTEQQEEPDSQPVRGLKKIGLPKGQIQVVPSEERSGRSEESRKRQVRNSDLDGTKATTGDEEEQRGRKRTRGSDIGVAASAEESQRGRRRTSPSDAETIPSAAEKTNHRRKADHQKAPEVETASARLKNSRPNPRKLPKPVKDPKAGSSSAPANEAQLTKRKQSLAVSTSESSKGQGKSSKQPSQIDQPAKQKRKSVNTLEKEPAKRRRVSKAVQEEEIEAEEVEEELPYQHLTAITRKVSRQTIETKWEPLPANCVERIAQLLSDIQRPVVVRLSDERRRTQASTALQMVSRRLVGKISKGIPFPPGTRNHREDDFDFEKILDHNRSFEAQLTPALHANELLESELNKELSWLEVEREKLEELETNAKAEANMRKTAAKKVHAVLLPNSSDGDMEGMEGDIGLDVELGKKSVALQLISSNDEDLTSLVTAIEGHVESIQGNLKQVHGITEAIAKSKAAVQSTLFSHLDIGQYQEVVME